MRAPGALVAAALVLVLAGCAAIPTSGGVQLGGAQPQDSPNAQFVPPPPVQGASKLAIVQGFIYAQAEGRQYRVAKQYLTRQFASTWRPDAGVIIQDKALTAADAGNGRVELRVPSTAEVDDVGAYTLRSGTRALQFALQRVGGEWRIAAGPPGVVLPQSVFQQNFVSEPVQYFDSRSARLVPDLRWFPRTASPDDLVRTVLGGLPDSSPLQGVVRSAFPPGTRLAAPVVSGRESRTTVSLTVPGGTPDAAATARMQQQLAGTLSVAPARVSLIVNGTLVSRARSLAPATVGPNSVVLAGGRFGPISERGVTDDSDTALGRRIVAARPTAVTISARQRLAAVLTRAGAAVVTPGGSRLVDDRPGVVAPTLDQLGWTYSVPRDDPGGLRATSSRGVRVDLPGNLDGTSVTAIEASFDGTRMLVLTDTPTGSQAYVVGIERAPDGTPTGLTADQYPVRFDADTAVDGTWIDDGSVAVLTGGSDQQTVQQTVVEQQLGGISRPLGRLLGATHIVGMTGVGDLRMLIGATGDLNDLPNGFPQSVFADPVKVSVLAVQR